VLDCNQGVDDLVAGLEQESRQGHEGDPGFCRPDSPIPCSSEESDRGVFLKLSRLDTEIGLGCMKYLRSCSNPLFFEDGKQIAEVTKLCPVIHSPSLSEEGVLW
jgi:hypothetical protein